MGDATSLKIAQTGIVRLEEVRTTMMGYYRVLTAGTTALALDYEQELSACFLAARLRRGSEFYGVRISPQDALAISPIEHELLWQAWENWTTQHGCITLPISGIFVAYFLDIQSAKLRPRYLHILELYRAATVPFYRQLVGSGGKVAKYFSSVSEVGIWDRMVLNELEPSLYHWTAIGEIFKRGDPASRRASSGGIANGGGIINGSGRASGGSSGSGESRRASTSQLQPVARAGNQSSGIGPIRHQLPPSTRSPPAPQVGAFPPRVSSVQKRPPQPPRPPPQPQRMLPAQNFAPPVGPRHPQSSQHFPPTTRTLFSPSAAPQHPPRRPQQNTQQINPTPGSRQFAPQRLPLPPPHFDNSTARPIAESEQAIADRRAIDNLREAETNQLLVEAQRQKDKELAAADRKSKKRVQDDTSYSVASAGFWRAIGAKTPVKTVASREAGSGSAGVSMGRVASGSGSAATGTVRGGEANGDGALRNGTDNNGIPSTRDEDATTAQSSAPERLTVGELTVRVMSAIEPTTNERAARDTTSHESKEGSALVAVRKETTSLSRKEVPSRNPIASTSELPAIVLEKSQVPPAVFSTALQFYSPASSTAPQLAFEFAKVSAATTSLATPRLPQIVSATPVPPTTAPGPAPPLPSSQIYSRDVYRPPPSIPNGPFSRQSNGGIVSRNPLPTVTAATPGGRNDVAKSANSIPAPAAISTTLPLPPPTAIATKQAPLVEEVEKVAAKVVEKTLIEQNRATEKDAESPAALAIVDGALVPRKLAAPVVPPVVSARKNQVDEMEIDESVAKAAESTKKAPPKLTAQQLIALASPRTSTITPCEERQTSPIHTRSPVQTKASLAKPSERRPSASSASAIPAPPSDTPAASKIPVIPPPSAAPAPPPPPPPIVPLESALPKPPPPIAPLFPPPKPPSTALAFTSKHSPLLSSVQDRPTASNGVKLPIPSSTAPRPAGEPERSTAKLHPAVIPPVAPPLQTTASKPTPTPSVSLPRPAFTFAASTTAPVSAQNAPPVAARSALPTANGQNARALGSTSIQASPQVSGSLALVTGLQLPVSKDATTKARSPSNLAGKGIKAVDPRASSGIAKTSSAVASTSTVPRATPDSAGNSVDAVVGSEAKGRPLGPSSSKAGIPFNPVAGESPARTGSSATARGFVPRVSSPIILPRGRSLPPSSHLRQSSVDSLPSAAPKKKAAPSLVAKRIVVPPAGGSSMTKASLAPAVASARAEEREQDGGGVDTVSKGKRKMLRELSISSDEELLPIKKRKVSHNIPLTVDLSSTTSLVFDLPVPSPKKRRREASVVL